MTDLTHSQQPESQKRHHTWHEIVVPTAKGVERFFWKAAWFALIVWFLFFQH